MILKMMMMNGVMLFLLLVAYKSFQFFTQIQRRVALLDYCDWYFVVRITFRRI